MRLSQVIEKAQKQIALHEKKKAEGRFILLANPTLADYEDHSSLIRPQDFTLVCVDEENPLADLLDPKRVASEQVEQHLQDQQVAKSMQET